MKQIRQYFPFFILTVLLYGVVFHFYQQSTIIPPTPLNSGRQAVQLQFIELTAAHPEKTEALSKAAERTTETVKEKSTIVKTAEEKTAATVSAEDHSAIKVARQKLHKTIQETPAINDAMLKAELFAADYQQVPVTPDAAPGPAEKTAAKLPAAERKPVKKLRPVKEAKQQDTLQQKEKPKPLFKKQASTSHSRIQTQGVLQEAIVVSGNTPVYPKRAILRNQQGRVVVKLLVTSKGKGRKPQIITSSGHSLLDNAVLNFIRKELFMPAHRGEKKITSEQVFSFRFELK